MIVYLQGHVKRNPETGAVAVRTRFDERPEFQNYQWAVSCPIGGPRSCTTGDVESWDDLYVPDEAGS